MNIFLSFGIESLVILVLLCVLMVFLICVIIYFCAYERKKKKFFDDKVFIIDYANKIVRYFSKKKLDGVSSIALNTFYRFFDYESGKMLEEKIDNFFKTGVSNNFCLDVDSLRQFNTQEYFRSLVDVTSINQKRQLLHCNLYYFRYLPLLYHNDSKAKRKIDKVFNMSDVNIDLCFKNAIRYEGCSYMFNLTLMLYLNSLNVNNFIYYSFFDILAKNCKDKTIVRFSEYQFVVHDFKINNSVGIFSFISKVKNDFDIFLSLNNLNQFVRFNIGIVEHRYFPKDYTLTMKNLKQITASAVEQNKPYLFFDTNIKTPIIYDPAYKAEAESIILNHKLSYKFAPIVDCLNANIIGYKVLITPTSNVFKDFKEVREYSTKLGLTRKIFMEIMKSIVSKTTTELSPSKAKSINIFYELPFEGLEVAISNIRYINNFDNCNITYVFNEKDISNNLTSQLIVNRFLDFGSKHQIGLIVEEQSMILPDDLYKAFSFFVFESSSVTSSRLTSHDSFVLKKSIEKVLKFNQKIILTNVNTLPEVELRIQLELRYMSGLAFGEPNEMFLPLDKKIIDKILKFNDSNK